MTIAMHKDQIASFVQDLLDAGASLFAAGESHYFFGDEPADRADEISAKVNAICKRYGERDHLRREIVSHLKSLGFEIEVDRDASGVAAHSAFASAE